MTAGRVPAGLLLRPFVGGDGLRMYGAIAGGIAIRP